MYAKRAQWQEHREKDWTKCNMCSINKQRHWAPWQWLEESCCRYRRLSVNLQGPGFPLCCHDLSKPRVRRKKRPRSVRGNHYSVLFQQKIISFDKRPCFSEVLSRSENGHRYPPEAENSSNRHPRVEILKKPLLIKEGRRRWVVHDHLTPAVDHSL